MELYHNLERGTAFSKKKGFNIPQPKAPPTEAAEAEGCATMRAEMLGQPFPLCVSRALHPDRL